MSVPLSRWITGGQPGGFVTCDDFCAPTDALGKQGFVSTGPSGGNDNPSRSWFSGDEGL